LTWRCFNSNSRRFGCFTSILFHLENHICLSRGVQMTCVTWRAAMKIVTGVEDLVQRIMDDHTSRILSDRVIERSDDAVCGLHRIRGDVERMFLC
jgi:hypothetical protein